jgi:hypothetical protein
MDATARRDEHFFSGREFEMDETDWKKALAGLFVEVTGLIKDVRSWLVEERQLRAEEAKVGKPRKG